MTLTGSTATTTSSSPTAHRRRRRPARCRSPTGGCAIPESAPTRYARHGGHLLRAIHVPIRLLPASSIHRRRQRRTRRMSRRCSTHHPGERRGHQGFGHDQPRTGRPGWALLEDCAVSDKSALSCDAERAAALWALSENMLHNIMNRHERRRLEVRRRSSRRPSICSLHKVLRPPLSRKSASADMANRTCSTTSPPEAT